MNNINFIQKLKTQIKQKIIIKTNLSNKPQFQIKKQKIIIKYKL